MGSLVGLQQQMGAAFQGENLLHCCLLMLVLLASPALLSELMTPMGAVSSLTGGCKLDGGRVKKKITCNSCLMTGFCVSDCFVCFYPPKELGNLSLYISSFNKLF